jgi:DMSO/TMAO reductase YedYZ heme-binding membrane subunit
MCFYFAKIHYFCYLVLCLSFKGDSLVIDIKSAALETLEMS